MRITIPVSAGELVDKITILKVKAARLSAAEKLKNVRHELLLLEGVMAESLPVSHQLSELALLLQSVNARLWDIEDAKRSCERSSDFGPQFVALARQVYKLNDERAGLKRQINILVGSELIEEKSHAIGETS